MVYGVMGTKSAAAKMVSREAKARFRMRIRTDDSHGVAIESNSPSGLSSRVDKAEEVLLARLDLPERVGTGRKIWLGVVTIEEVVGRAGRTEVHDLLILLRASGVEAMHVS